VIDKDKAEVDAQRMLKGEFTLDDFYNQLQMIKRMGSLRDVMSKLPFMDEVMQQIPSEALDDYELVRVESVIQSMTRQERRQPDCFNESRIQRVAKGAGRKPQEVRDLLERFKMTREMMRNVGAATGAFGAKEARKMQQKLMQMARGMQQQNVVDAEEEAPLSLPQLSKTELEARRKKAKEARKARKAQRR